MPNWRGMQLAWARIRTCYGRASDRSMWRLARAGRAVVLHGVWLGTRRRCQLWASYYTSSHMPLALALVWPNFASMPSLPRTEGCNIDPLPK